MTAILVSAVQLAALIWTYTAIIASIAVILASVHIYDAYRARRRWKDAHPQAMRIEIEARETADYINHR